MPLETTIRSGFITDLLIPPSGTLNLTDAQLSTIAYDTALELLHDFHAYIRSNPLVQDVSTIDSKHPKYIDLSTMSREFHVDTSSTQSLAPNAGSGGQCGYDFVGDYVHHEITDTLPILFGVTQQLVYHTALRRTKSGFESFTNAGSGVKIHGTCELKHSSESKGVINFIEHNETRCNVFLGVYIKATLGSSHKSMHENFKKAWNERMKVNLGDVSEGKEWAGRGAGGEA